MPDTVISLSALSIRKGKHQLQRIEQENFNLLRGLSVFSHETSIIM